MATWKEYESQIYLKYKSYFPHCTVRYDDKVKGQFSKVNRQIDVSIRTKIDEFEIFGVVECKHFSKKINVKLVESFIGFLEDVKADFGYIITNKGFSKAAQNRADIKRIRLQIVEYVNLDESQFDLDELFNEKIKLLACIEGVFLMRQQQRSAFIDLEQTSFEEKVIAFKDGFARTEYFAHKKLLEESARVFRDFPCIKMIRVTIPSSYEGKEYCSELKLKEFEEYLSVDFQNLREDIKNWRGFLGSIRKPTVQDFGSRFVQTRSL